MNADAEAVRYRNQKTQSSHEMFPYRNKRMSNWERDVSTILFTMVLSGPKQGFFPQTTQLLYTFCTFRPEKRFFCSYYQKPYGLKPINRGCRSGFNRVSGSGSGFGIWIRIQEGKSRKKNFVLKCWTPEPNTSCLGPFRVS